MFRSTNGAEGRYQRCRSCRSAIAAATASPSGENNTPGVCGSGRLLTSNPSFDLVDRRRVDVLSGSGVRRNRRCRSGLIAADDCARDGGTKRCSMPRRIRRTEMANRCRSDAAVDAGRVSERVLLRGAVNLQPRGETLIMCLEIPRMPNVEQVAKHLVVDQLGRSRGGRSPNLCDGGERLRESARKKERPLHAETIANVTQNGTQTLQRRAD